jgi:outer membrane protein
MYASARAIAGLLLCSTLASPGTAEAQDAQEAQKERPGWRWGLGVGGIAQDLGYKGQDGDARLVPIIYAESDRFFLMGPRAGWRFVQSDRFTLSAVANYRFDGYDSNDSRALEGMDDRDGSLDAGVELQYRADFGTLTFSAVTDTLDKSSGQEVSLRYGYPFSLARGTVSPFIESAWLSDDLVDYYYGVRPEEAREGRPAYRPDSTFNTTLGVNGTWLFDRRHLVFLNAGYQWLGSEIEDSPIMNADAGASVILGWVYTF